ncbi:MAG: TolC family protein [bacterium]|nr:TolC family protein [bacterium]
MLTILTLTIVGMAELDPPVVQAGNEELRAYLLEAGTNSPALHARYEAWRAALEKVPQVTALDDPMLTYGYFLQSEINRHKIMLAQKLPWWGTLRAKGEQVEAEAEALLAKLYSERNRVFADVKRAYFDYAFLARQIEVTESQVEILAYVEDLVQSKLALGTAGEDELLRVSIEKAKLDDRLQGLRDMRPVLSARLRETLGRDAGENLPWPQAAELPPLAPEADDALARARTANPDLRAFDHLLESRKKQEELARKKGWPDVTFSIDYASISKPRQNRPDRPYPATLNAIQRLRSIPLNASRQALSGQNPTPPVLGASNTLVDAYSILSANEPMTYSDGGEDNLMVSVAFNVPIWRGKIRAGVREAEHLQQQVERDKHRRALALDQAVHTALFGMTDSRRRIALYQDNLLPLAQRTYESLQGGYAVGAPNAAYIDLLESIQTLLDFDLERLRAERDLHTAAADLELLVGGPWDKAAK